MANETLKPPPPPPPSNGGASSFKPPPPPPPSKQTPQDIASPSDLLLSNSGEQNALVPNVDNTTAPKPEKVSPAQLAKDIAINPYKVSITNVQGGIGNQSVIAKDQIPSKEERQKQLDKSFNELLPGIKQMEVFNVKAYNGALDILNNVTQLALGAPIVGKSDITRGAEDFFDYFKADEPSGIDYKGGVPTVNNVAGAMGSMLPFLASFAIGAGELSAAAEAAGASEVAASTIGTVGTNMVLGYNQAYNDASDAGVKDEVAKNEYALGVTALGGMLFSALPALRQIKGFENPTVLIKYGIEDFTKALEKGKAPREAVNAGLKATMAAVLNTAENSGILTGIELTNKLNQVVSNLTTGQNNFDTTLDPKEIGGNLLLNLLVFSPFAAQKGIETYRNANPLYKQALVQAGNNPELFKTLLDKKLADGSITQEQHAIANNQITKAKLIASQIPNNTPLNKVGDLTYHNLIVNDVKDQIKPLQDQIDEISSKADLSAADLTHLSNLHDQVRTHQNYLDIVVGKDVEYKGEIGVLKRDDEGNYVFDNGDGKEKILPLEDKNNPTESLDKLGVKVLPDLSNEQVSAAAKDKEQVGMVFSKNGNQFFVSLSNPNVENKVGDQVLLVGKNGKLKDVGMPDADKLKLINKFLEEKGLPPREFVLNIEQEKKKATEVKSKKSEPVELPVESDVSKNQEKIDTKIADVESIDTSTPTTEESAVVQSEVKPQKPIVQGNEVPQTKGDNVVSGEGNVVVDNPTAEDFKQLNDVHTNLAGQYLKRHKELVREGLRGDALTNHPDLVDIQSQMDKIENYFRQNNPKLADNEAEQSLIESKLAAEDNTEQEPSITVIEGKANSNDETQLSQAATEASGKIESATGVVNFPVKDISTDTEKYQGRKQAFSERSVKKITTGFDENKLDPVVLYKAADGKTYILSGHSRLEAHRQLGKENIKARFFEGTPEEAKKFALESNKLGTLQTDLENAAHYREQLKKGKSYNAVLKEAKENEQEGAATRTVNLAHLNPKGKTIQALEALENKEGESTTNALQIANRIGELRAFNEHLTNAHENELFDYFADQKTIPSKEMVEKQIGASINAVKFNPEEPLNLKKTISKSGERVDWEKTRDDLESEIKTLRDSVKPNKETGWNPIKEEIIARLSADKSKESIDAAQKDFEENKNGSKDLYDRRVNDAKELLKKKQDDLAKHLLTEKDLIQGEKAQVSMFDQPLEKVAKDFADKLREKKGKPLMVRDPITGEMHEVKTSSFFDDAIELTASLIEKAGKVLDHTKLGDAILAGLKHLRENEWYRKLKMADKKAVIAEFKGMFQPLKDALVKNKNVSPEKQINETTGVTQKQNKIRFTVNEKTALKDQLRAEARAAMKGYKQAKFEQKAFARKIADALEEQKGSGKLTIPQYKAIVKAASKVNSMERLNDFIDFSSRVVDDANYANDLSKARASLNNAIGRLKGDNIPIYNKQLLSALRDLNPARVTDLAKYTDILQSLSKELQGKEKGRKYTQAEIEQFIAGEQDKIRIEDDARLQSELDQYIEDGDVAKETTLADYKSMLEELDRYQEEGKITAAVKDRIIDRIKDNIATLKDEARAARVIQTNVRQETPLEKQTMDDVMAFDPYTADTKTLQRLNNVLNNYIESGDLSGAGDIVAAHQSAVRLKAAKDEGIKIKQLQTRNRFLFSQNISRKSLPNILRELTYSKKAAASIADLTVSKIKQAAADAHDVRNKVMTNILKVAEKAKLRERNNYRMHVYSMLSQANSFTINGEPVTFDMMKQRLMDDANRMIDYGSKLKTKGAGDTKGKDIVEWGESIKDILGKDFASAKDAEEVYSKLSEGEKKVYGMTRDFFDARSGKTQQVTEIVENKSMPLVENYFPLDAMRLGEESTSELALSENDLSKNFVSKKQAGSTIKRQPLEHDRIYNPQFLHVFAKKAFEQEFYNNGQQELHTLSKVLNDKQFADVVNETSNPERNLENATIMRQTLSGIVNEWKQSGSLPNQNTQVVNYVLRKTIGTLLSTVGQLPKQYIPNVTQAAVINGIGPTIRAISLRYGKEKVARDKLLNAMSGKVASGRGEVVLEESLYKDQLAGMKSNAFATLHDLRENTPVVSDILNLGKNAFTLGDQSGRNDAFLSSYIKSLMDQGLIKGAADFDVFKESENPNQKALSYAEITAPTIANVSTTAERPELVKSVNKREWSDRIQWTLLTYGLNSYESAKTASRILFDARSNKSERMEAATDLSGYLVQIATFAAVSGVIKSAIYRPAGQAIGSALGYQTSDEDKKNAIEKDKVRVAAKAVTDVTFQGSPIYLQEGGQYAVNKAYQFINKNFMTEHPYSKENKGTVQDANFKPFYGTDQPTMGIVDVPMDIASDATSIATSKSTDAEKKRTMELITMAKVVSMLLSNGDLYSLANYTGTAVSQAEKGKVNSKQSKVINSD